LATPARTNGSPRSKPAARNASPAVNGKRISPKAPVKANPTPPQKPEAKVLFQKFFHSIGPRTYAAQVKELGNGNHLLVLTEGKRDADSGEVRKTRLLIFGEDLTSFFKLLSDTAAFIRANPLSEEIRDKRRRMWAKRNRESRAAVRPQSD
jgi:Protein of unknown function (DUF3276)